MEVTAAERTTIYTNISPLAQRVNNYYPRRSTRASRRSPRTSATAAPPVSRYLTGKYDSNPNDLRAS